MIRLKIRPIQGDKLGTIAVVQVREDVKLLRSLDGDAEKGTDL